MVLQLVDEELVVTVLGEIFAVFDFHGFAVLKVLAGLHIGLMVLVMGSNSLLEVAFGFNQRICLGKSPFDDAFADVAVELIQLVKVNPGVVLSHL